MHRSEHRCMLFVTTTMKLDATRRIHLVQLSVYHVPWVILTYVQYGEFDNKPLLQTIILHSTREISIQLIPSRTTIRGIHFQRQCRSYNLKKILNILYIWSSLSWKCGSAIPNPTKSKKLIQLLEKIMEWVHIFSSINIRLDFPLTPTYFIVCYNKASCNCCDDSCTYANVPAALWRPKCSWTFSRSNAVNAVRTEVPGKGQRSEEEVF